MILKLIKKLLVAKNMKLYQEVYSEMLKMPTKQSTAHEESRRTSPTENTSRTMVGNQYQHYWTTIKIK